MVSSLESGGDIPVDCTGELTGTVAGNGVSGLAGGGTGVVSGGDSGKTDDRFNSADSRNGTVGSGNELEVSRGGAASSSCDRSLSPESGVAVEIQDGGGSAKHGNCSKCPPAVIGGDGVERGSCP